mmetsp:Transcript_15226/g.27643  ORF Transcript_15226/g.27643 Transcript_15226/m.27643 type:complete len:187 (+) Transcript_15226:160-720(+)|eukprot:CAMPEP_0201868658 /NCGR_PEP_ID=MMETSP0902-20130614/2449_1 /ASSEMBLY_ACC=CAM_ASM_000551 /TAXON_ID=420261 /ORGANISM="Thalassiosira antarctica, Strain CCMP982" /LENGTH=186 /DNA_ID=CAMNT_0048394021 /DNA_START=159 /DNA_END=719 /DNA_ORIENTATION=+
MTPLSLLLVLASLCVGLPSASAFSRPPSSIAGRASSVASRAELLTTELSCPPFRMKLQKGSKTLGLKKSGSDEEKEPEENENMMTKIKSAGAAGAISLFLWELTFWAISIPVAIFGFVSVAGSWPDLSDKDDLAKVGAEAFAFANIARFALPVRIGLAVSTTPWVKDNIVEASWAQSFFNKDNEEA